jgi:hypothetical protein
LKNKTYGDCFLKRFTRPLNKLKNPTSTRKQLGIKKCKGKKQKKSKLKHRLKKHRKNSKNCHMRSINAQNTILKDL